MAMATTTSISVNPVVEQPSIPEVNNPFLNLAIAIFL
jgi:hypothetical protein